MQLVFLYDTIIMTICYGYNLPIDSAAVQGVRAHGRLDSWIDAKFKLNPCSCCSRIPKKPDFGSVPPSQSSNFLTAYACGATGIFS